MSKKQNKPLPTAKDCIVVDGINVPQEAAVLFSAYYNAFLTRGF